MRMCLVSPQLGLSPLSNLGGEVVDRETLKGLAKLGVEIEVLLPKDRPFPKIKNLKVSFALIKPMFPAYIFNLFVFCYLWKIFKREEFDLIRIHNPYFVGLGAWLFKKLFCPEIPIVPFYYHLEDKFLFSLIDKLLIKKWDLVLTCSKASKKEIVQRFKVSPEKIKVVYCGVLRKFKPQKKDQKLISKYRLQGKIVLLFVGVLTKRKNTAFLLDLLTKAKDEKLKLIICGQGAELKSLKKKTKVLNLEKKVIFLGFQRDLVRLYNLADIFVFPTLKEGFGLVVVEAMACEKPVIVSRNSSLPELVDNNKNGFLAETNDLDDWTRKLRILIENKNLRKEFGKKGRKKVLENFSWEKAARKNYQIYKSLSKEKKVNLLKKQ